MSDIEKVARLLGSPEPEVQVAAAVVLGELGSKNARVVDGLLAMATSEQPGLQVPALEALAKIAPRRALSRLMPLVAEGPTSVRRAAGQALAALGPGVVEKIGARLEEAGAEERRVLTEVLSAVSGKDAFKTLLHSLLELEPDQARQAALGARPRLRGLGAPDRKRYLTQVKQFLRTKQAAGSPAATAAAIKLLGFLETADALPVLLEHATDTERPEAVRTEAVIAMRFALGAARSEAARQSVAAPLVQVVAEAPPDLSRAARDTLSFVKMPAGAAKALGELAAHPDVDRARFAVQALGAIAEPAAWEALGQVIAEGARPVAEAAAEVLRGQPEAAPVLLKLLLSTEDAGRAWAVARALEPHAEALDGRQHARLIKVALGRLAADEPAWEAPLRIARLGAPAKAAEALRELAGREKRKQDKTRALRIFRLLARGQEATAQDRYELASLELRESPRDLKRASRERDPALELLGELAEDPGFDVAAALGRDRGLDLEALYYVGFHFAEEGEPLGEALLERVVQKGGRKKIARAARNKLRLTSG